MKVLICCFTDLRSGGGGGTHAKAVADGLAGKGGRYDVCLLSKSATADTAGKGEYHSMPVEYYHISNGIFWRIPSLRRTAKIAEVLKNVEKPDAVLCISPYIVNAARKVWPDVKIIYLFPCLLYRCMPFTVDRRDLWFVIEHMLTGKVEASAFDNCDKVIFQSPVVLGDAKTFHDFPQEKIRMCAYGSTWLEKKPDVDGLEMRQMLNTPQDATILVGIGVMDRNKNFEYVLEELAVSQTGLWLWLIGDGPDREKLQAKTRELGIDSRVRFLGWRDDVINCYNAADALVHAAYYDAFPHIYPEAMTCKLPLIGPTNKWPEVISSMNYIIDDGVEGWLYDLTEPGELAQIFVVIDNHPDVLKPMGQAAYERVKNELLWSHYVDLVEELLNEE